MEARPGPWIRALRSSHENLCSVVQALVPEQLHLPSYARDWSIAKVMSHLGSQAEIHGLILAAGLRDEVAPGQDVFIPIWQAWDNKAPEVQVGDALEMGKHLLESFEGLTAEQVDRWRMHVFGMDLDAAGLAKMRVREQALHAWDVEVALNASATLSPGIVEQLLGTLEEEVPTAAKPSGAKLEIKVETSAPEGEFTLRAAETVTLRRSTGDECQTMLKLPAEGLIRLVYGRLDPAHTPPVWVSGVDLDELRRLFPGV
jgi:uncharacterized protein (TIGR03083 family)